VWFVRCAYQWECADAVEKLQAYSSRCRSSSVSQLESGSGISLNQSESTCNGIAFCFPRAAQCFIAVYKSRQLRLICEAYHSQPFRYQSASKSTPNFSESAGSNNLSFSSAPRGFKIQIPIVALSSPTSRYIRPRVRTETWCTSWQCDYRGEKWCRTY
jgi:hypothetical protein